MTQPDYFVDGGTLDPNSPSYVKRPADDELPQKVLAGTFCYVLTARQMGKSSLMVRTVRDLRARGVKVALVDLTVVGAEEILIDQWYFSILNTIGRELQLKTDVLDFWERQRLLSPPQRFSQFLHDIVLTEILGQVAVFIDEIDSTQKLTFSDDFFRAIRAVYNTRASDPVYKRLTFTLLGVATPTDLINDPNGTPFNIGSPVPLQGFSYADAAPLRNGLEQRFPGQGDRILRRIFYWTNGHPYLTQHLCLHAAQADLRQWSDQDVDTLVARRFFAEDARSNTNLTYVRDRIRLMQDDKRHEMLTLYQRIYAGEAISENDREEPQRYLKLWGVVQGEQGVLRTANRIYQRVFDQSWVREQMRTGKTEPLSPPPPPPSRIGRYVLAAIVVFTLLGIAIWLATR